MRVLIVKPEANTNENNNMSQEFLDVDSLKSENIKTEVCKRSNGIVKDEEIQDELLCERVTINHKIINIEESIIAWHDGVKNDMNDLEKYLEKKYLCDIFMKLKELQGYLQERIICQGKLMDDKFYYHTHLKQRLDTAKKNKKIYDHLKCHSWAIRETLTESQLQEEDNLVLKFRYKTVKDVLKTLRNWDRKWIDELHSHITSPNAEKIEKFIDKWTKFVIKNIEQLTKQISSLNDKIIEKEIQVQNMESKYKNKLLTTDNLLDKDTDSEVTGSTNISKYNKKHGKIYKFFETMLCIKSENSEDEYSDYDESEDEYEAFSGIQALSKREKLNRIKIENEIHNAIKECEIDINKENEIPNPSVTSIPPPLDICTDDSCDCSFPSTTYYEGSIDDLPSQGNQPGTSKNEDNSVNQEIQPETSNIEQKNSNEVLDKYSPDYQKYLDIYMQVESMEIAHDQARINFLVLKNDLLDKYCQSQCIVKKEYKKFKEILREQVRNNDLMTKRVNLFGPRPCKYVDEIKREVPVIENIVVMQVTVQPAENVALVTPIEPEIQVVTPQEIEQVVPTLPEVSIIPQISGAQSQMPVLSAEESLLDVLPMVLEVPAVLQESTVQEVQRIPEDSVSDLRTLTQFSDMVRQTGVSNLQDFLNTQVEITPTVIDSPEDSEGLEILVTQAQLPETAEESLLELPLVPELPEMSALDNMRIEINEVKHYTQEMQETTTKSTESKQDKILQLEEEINQLKESNNIRRNDIISQIERCRERQENINRDLASSNEYLQLRIDDLSKKYSKTIKRVEKNTCNKNKFSISTQTEQITNNLTQPLQNEGENVEEIFTEEQPIRIDLEPLPSLIEIYEYEMALNEDPAVMYTDRSQEFPECFTVHRSRENRAKDFKMRRSKRTDNTSKPQWKP